MSDGLSIEGLQNAQQDNLRRISAMQPSGGLGRAVLYMSTSAHRYVVSITHVITGSLRASHRIKVDGLRGEIYIDPSAVNPRSGKHTAIYGPYEHARGGEHAFYKRTEQDYGPKVLKAGAAVFVQELP